MSKNDKDVHTEHCKYRQCKYGEEDSCSVYLGYRKPTYDKSKAPSRAEFRRRRTEAQKNDPIFD